MSENELKYRNLINRIAGAMIVFLVLFYATDFIATIISETIAPLLTDHARVAFSSILDSASYLVSFMLPLLAFKFLSRNNLSEVRNMPFKAKLPSDFPLYIVVGVAVTLAFAYFNSVFMNLFFPEVSSSQNIHQVRYGYEYILIFISVAVVPAFCEEFLFRGVILNNLLPYGKVTAIIISSLLFGLMHQNYAQFLYTTFSGIILAVVCIETKSIWCSMFVHLFNNMTSVLDQILSEQLNPEVTPYLMMIFDAAILVAGVICFIVLIKKHDRNQNNEQEKIDSGFFGKEPEQSYSSALRYVDYRYKIKYFFTPMMTAFCIISFISMIIFVAS